MPYSGASDKNLPDNIKDKPLKVRKHWVGAFNSAYEDCEAENGKDCEGRAFRIANAAIKPEETMTKIEGTLEKTQEELQEHDEPVFVPYGIHNFDDLDAATDAALVAKSQFVLLEQFKQLANNILYANAEEVPDKTSALETLTADFVVRLKLDAAAAEMPGTIDDEYVVSAENGRLLIEGAFTDIELLESDESGPLLLEMVVIEPGFGNKRDNHYYTGALLEEYAHVFSGVKMYATDHRQDEKSVRTEVSEVIECPVRFTESGAPVAKVGVHDPYFAKSVRNREELGTLSSLHCSILADGEAVKDEIEGRECKRVTKITEAFAVDWVTRAGAGGHALNILEEQSAMKDKEKLETEVEELEEEEVAPVVIKEEDAEPETQPEPEPEPEPDPEPVTLALAEVAARLGQTALPQSVFAELVVVEYADSAALDAAIEQRKKELREAGSGKPAGLAARAAVPDATLEEANKRKDAVNRKWLGTKMPPEEE